MDRGEISCFGLKCIEIDSMSTHFNLLILGFKSNYRLFGDNLMIIKKNENIQPLLGGRLYQKR